MRDGLMMRGNHHMPAGKRHWRSDAGAFAITDAHKNPMLWIEGNEVVGDISLTIAKPQYLGTGCPDIQSNETLLRFEVGKVGGMPVILTWWARGKNVEHTQRVCRSEILDPKTYQERMKQLLQLMNWI